MLGSAERDAGGKIKRLELDPTKPGNTLHKHLDQHAAWSHRDQRQATHRRSELVEPHHFDGSSGKRCESRRATVSSRSW